jgi:hypothetical protein
MNRSFLRWPQRSTSRERKRDFSEAQVLDLEQVIEGHVGEFVLLVTSAQYEIETASLVLLEYWSAMLPQYSAPGAKQAPVIGGSDAFDHG